MAQSFVLRTADGREYPISGPAYIGREADCLIRFNDSAVSRHHARVWPEPGALWLQDENSVNGVYVNGSRLLAAQPYQLKPGDRVQLGGTAYELLAVAGPPAPAPAPAARPAPSPRPAQTTHPARPAPPARRLAPFLLVGVFGCLLLLGLGTLAGLYLIFGRTAAAPASTPVTVMALVTPAPLLSAPAYAASSQALAQAVADLNQAELAFIQTAAMSYRPSAPGRLALPAPMTLQLDEGLRQLAASAMRLATLADALHQTAAAQGQGSDAAGQTAAHYNSMAQLGAALVIEAQDLRAGLAQGGVTPQAAAASVAEYGARLWNPAVTDLSGAGNPFSAYLSNPAAIPVAIPLAPTAAAQLSSQLGTGLTAWVAATADTSSKSFNLPPASQPGAAPGANAADPARLAALSTAAGQADANAARQAATALLRASNPASNSGAPTSGESAPVTAAFFNAVAVSSPATPAATPGRAFSAFPQGSASAVSLPTADEVISTLITLDSNNSPTVAAQTPVQATQPLVNLSISDVRITQVNQISKDGFSTFDAEATYEFEVTWNTNLASPQFTLECAGGNQFEISRASGSQRVTAKGLMTLYPGSLDAYCYASRNGNTWGGASTRFLVGDAAGATQRANQVETDAMALDLTLTAEVQGTLAVQAAGTAAAQTSVAIENAVSTEVAAAQTAEFRALITDIARQTEQALPPTITHTPLPTPTFTPVLVDSLFHPGDEFAVSSNVKLQRGRLYRVCLSGVVNLTTGPALPSDIDFVNGIKVPLSGCVVLEGNDAAAVISCSSGEPAEDPGGFTIEIFDLGPF